MRLQNISIQFMLKRNRYGIDCRSKKLNHMSCRSGSSVISCNGIL